MKIFDRVTAEATTIEIIKAIQNGSIFVYPTDTIYGLGCNALNGQAVQKIREIKQRETQPFSIIAPSKEWVMENCEVEAKDLDQYLPGPFTLFLKTKGKVVAHEVNPNLETLGVRIPDHWFTKFIAEAQVPFVTTSVNVTGEPYAKRIEDIEAVITARVDICIDEGEKPGPSSTKINLAS